MEVLKVDFTKDAGKIKRMHATNNGPACGPIVAYGAELLEKRGNFETFAAAGIPYVRNHDASLSEAYGSQHLVDVHCIFTDFSKDLDDESAYDFTLTDVYTKNILDTGAKVFYRLGSSIEHWKKKYGTLVPPDFHKWAAVCEHIIRHYNEGWANGFRYDIEYWEIWNEPDMNADDCADKKTWGGTKAQFFDFFETAARHLKETFPQLKIGGPAICGNEAWGDEFLAEMHKREISLDFFSWHIYCVEPTEITEKAKRIRSIMRKNGYERAESILNEWNYVKDWGRPLEYIRAIKGMKGAAFCAAVMCAAQNCDVDMLMYYDARIEKVWNGMFSSDTLLPLKGYYPFKMFNLLYRYGTACECSVTEENVYAVAAKNEKGENAVMLCYYTDRAEGAESKTISSDFFGGANRYEVFLLDEKTNGEKVGVVAKDAEIKLEKNTVLLLKSL